jgi:hypothetical protein
MKGRVNTPSCGTVPDQLIGAPHSTSMMPWRMAENSRSCWPCTRLAPGYCLMLMRPLVRSRTSVRKISPPLAPGESRWHHGAHLVFGLVGALRMGKARQADGGGAAAGELDQVTTLHQRSPWGENGSIAQ